MTDRALGRIEAFRPHAAVVFGSGLATLLPGTRVEAELRYEELGWPCTAVPGHANLLRLARVPFDEGNRELRLALACGRPHLYEGWSEDELRRSVRDLVNAGAVRILLTNSCGALRDAVKPSDIVVCREAVDLQWPPASREGAGAAIRPPHLGVCSRAAANAVVAAMGPSARTGTYVAVAGPQYETPAEVAWLAGLGDVVGMSAAPELRAARAAGAEVCLLGLVANRAAAVGSHNDVLAAGEALAGALAAAVPAALFARWPRILPSETQGATWTS